MATGPKPGSPRTPTGKGAVSRPISFTAEHNDLIQDAIRHDKIGASEFVRRAIDEAQEKVSWESVEAGIKAAIQETMLSMTNMQPASAMQVAEATPQNQERVIGLINVLVEAVLHVQMIFKANNVSLEYYENQALHDSADGNLTGQWLELRDRALGAVTSSDERIAKLNWQIWWMILQKMAHFHDFFPVQWGCVRPVHALSVQALFHVLLNLMHSYGWEESGQKLVEVEKDRHQLMEKYWPSDSLEKRPRMEPLNPEAPR